MRTLLLDVLLHTLYETHDLVIHSLVVLLMNGIIVKIDYSSFCWGPPGTQSRTPGTLRTPLWEPLTQVKQFMWRDRSHPEACLHALSLFWILTALYVYTAKREKERKKTKMLSLCLSFYPYLADSDKVNFKQGVTLEAVHSTPYFHALKSRITLKYLKHFRLTT